jgi:hypothetical protein
MIKSTKLDSQVNDFRHLKKHANVNKQTIE